MGYSTPKKQLNLKEFLSQPAPVTKYRNNWRRTAFPPSKASETQETVAEKTSDTPS